MIDHGYALKLLTIVALVGFFLAGFGAAIKGENERAQILGALVMIWSAIMFSLQVMS